MRWSVAILVVLVALAGCFGTTVESPSSPLADQSHAGTPAEGPSTNSNAEQTTSDAISELTVTVTAVVDGDTIDIRYQNGSNDTVRLLGVDTPEVHMDNEPAEFEGVPETAAGASCLREEGQDASEFASKNLLHQEVQLQFDRLSDQRGHYGRLLAYVYIEGENFNYELVAEGHARVYESEFTDLERFSDAEAQAQSAMIGVWRCTQTGTEPVTPTPTPSTRGSMTLSVAEIHADAMGNDHENLIDEYVVFQNTGDETLDLGGWEIKDGADHSYVVPTGFSLEPGQTVTLFTGTGANSETELYWGSDSAVWNNAGDTISVYDAAGSLQVERRYP